MKMNMTKRQQEFYAVLRDHLTRNPGQSPSIDELCKMTGHKSKSSVIRILDALENRGWIIRKRHIARSITLVEDRIDLTNPQNRAALIAAGWIPPKEERI